MIAVWQKIKADVTGRLLISLLTLITIISATTLLTLALATLLNLSEPYDRSFTALNGAHLWLDFDRDKIRRRDVERIEAFPEVAASTGMQYSVRSRVQIHDTRVWVSIRLTPLEQPDVNRLLIQEGRYLRDQSEVLASRDLFDLYDLSVGDNIQITRQDGKKETFPIIGLAYNPTWDTYRNTHPPYLYINETLFRDLYPDETTWKWSLGVRLANPDAVDEVLTQIEAILQPDAIQTHTDWRDVKRSANFGGRLNFILLGAFSLFAIFGTVLVIVSSISSFVLSQFRQVGILKAIGFTKAQILWLYMGQYLILGLIGCPAGLGLGILLSPLPLKNIASSLSTTFRPPLNPLIILAVISSVPSIIVLATWQSAQRAAKANIIKAIATGAEAPTQRGSWVSRLAVRLRFPIPLVLGLSDVFAKPFRSLVTGLNLVLGVIGIVFGLLLNETLETYKANPRLLGIAYDAFVTRSITSDNKVQHLLTQAPGVEAFYSEYRVDVETLSGETFQVRAVEGDLAAFPFRMLEGRLPHPTTYEAMAGQGLLDGLGLQVGDEIEVILKDQHHHPITWRIVGAYTEPVNVGQMLIVHFSTLSRLLEGDSPTLYYLKLAPDTNTALLKQYLEPKPESDLNLTLAGQAIPGVVVYLQLALFVLSGILISIALVNVFNTSLLTVQEKLRAIGVLKTIGFTPAQVITMVNTTAGVLGFLASIVGIPLGWAFTESLLTMLAKTYGFGTVETQFNPLYILALPILMIIVSISGSYLPGRRAGKLSIVSVLRGE
ncbi:MAG: FtsX-like permease family protein [Anaerolineae bacterium]|nr:FtsX-like permease family protein [Anaerolineae bacterium]